VAERVLEPGDLSDLSFRRLFGSGPLATHSPARTAVPLTVVHCRLLIPRPQLPWCRVAVQLRRQVVKSGGTGMLHLEIGQSSRSNAKRRRRRSPRAMYQGYSRGSLLLTTIVLWRPGWIPRAARKGAPSGAIVHCPSSCVAMGVLTHSAAQPCISAPADATPI
jgi:hypothetical protein